MILCTEHLVTRLISVCSYLLPIFISFLILVHPVMGASIKEICDARSISPKNASIIIIKSKYRLFFYLNGKYVKRYPIVLGKNPKDPKLYEGDNCTPEGIYRVKTKSKHDRWSKFILLDYPSQDDLDRYEMALKHGQIPKNNGHYAGVGGAIGIHGTYSEPLNLRGNNWTLGCISLLNGDIDEIFPYVEKGTLVYILR
jgi:murein L,D-transpeptidase YafK